MKHGIFIVGALAAVWYAHTKGYDLWTGDGWSKLFGMTLNTASSGGGCCAGCSSGSGGCTGSATNTGPMQNQSFDTHPIIGGYP